MYFKSGNQTLLPASQTSQEAAGGASWWGDKGRRLVSGLACLLQQALGQRRLPSCPQPHGASWTGCGGAVLCAGPAGVGTALGTGVLSSGHARDRGGGGEVQRKAWEAHGSWWPQCSGLLLSILGGAETSPGLGAGRGRAGVADVNSGSWCGLVLGAPCSSRRGPVFLLASTQQSGPPAPRRAAPQPPAQLQRFPVHHLALCHGSN